MVSLLDVNVLVALVVPEHEHHEAALAWYSGETNHGWATCAVTELGVIRRCAHYRQWNQLFSVLCDRLYDACRLSSHVPNCAAVHMDYRQQSINERGIPR